MTELPLRAVVAALLVLMAVAGRAADAPAAVSPQMKQVDDHTVIAGTLDLTALKAAYPDRVLVVDLRTPPEGTAEEAEAAAGLGIDYTNIPVAGASVVPAQIDQLRAALDGAGKDTVVVVHCASGNRAGMLWGAMQLRDGASLPDVEAELAGILTKPPAIEGLKAYARTLNADE